MDYQKLNGCSIRDGFSKFHTENPHVYKAFESQVFRAIGLGKKKIGAKSIVEWIRWEVYLSTNDISFKINNNYTSYYARLFVEKHPEHADIFSFRKLRNEEKGQYMEVDENGQLSFL